MNQKDISQKIRLVIISGTLEASLHPVPPVADGAPEWNIFRLAEAAACNPDSRLEIHVISPCETGQWDALQNYPVCAEGKYHHIVFNQFQLGVYRKVLLHLLPLRLLVRRLAKLPDLMSWWYLRRALPVVDDLCPDVVILNDRPQYIRFIRRAVIKGKLFLMLRYPLGESSRFLSLLEGILVNSRGMRTYVEQFIQPDVPPVWQMPNTLGDNFFAPDLAIDRFSHSEKVILFVGRLIEEKGARELLLAFQKIYAALPNSRMLICGAVGNISSGGDISLYERGLHQLAGQFPRGIVEFMGYVPNRQMQQYYHQASVAVFPSLPEIYVESFGMVALEAMRCGTPVVASRQPGFEELVLPGKTGLLVNDSRDIESLAQAILQILQNPDLAQHMGQAGYQRSLDYTPENGLRSLESILRNYQV